DSDRLSNVVVLLLLAVRIEAPGLFEDDDQHGRLRQVRLAPIRADRLERVEVLLAGALAVEELFLVLGTRPDSRLDRGIGDDDELPRLAVRAGGRRDGGLERAFEQSVRDRLVREVTNAAPATHQSEKLLASRQRDAVRQAGESKWQRPVRIEPLGQRRKPLHSRERSDAPSVYGAGCGWPSMRERAAAARVTAGPSRGGDTPAAA